MDIEAIVNKYERLIPAGAYTLAEGIRAALTEADAVMAMEHNFKMLQVEATVQSMEARIRQLEAERGLSETAIRCAVARGWCHQKNASKEMDVDLAIAISDEILAILDVAPETEAERVPVGWIPVSERLPEPGKVVMAYYKNSVGGDRIICGFHAPKHTLEVGCNDDESCYDFDDATDTAYMAEGWLERIDNWDEFRSIYVVEGEVTHWMPLPEAPRCRRRRGE